MPLDGLIRNKMNDKGLHKMTFHTYISVLEGDLFVLRGRL
jgi:hypothetical protein